jgi:hypothetical protein
LILLQVANNNAKILTGNNTSTANPRGSGKTSLRGRAVCRVGLLSSINLLLTKSGDYPVMFKTVTGDGENESDEKYMQASPKKIASLLGLSLRQTARFGGRHFERARPASLQGGSQVGL